MVQLDCHHSIEERILSLWLHADKTFMLQSHRHDLIWIKLKHWRHLLSISGVPTRTENRKTLEQFGTYVAQMLPKYVQAAQVTHVDELELLIAPSAVVPVMTFLKVCVYVYVCLCVCVFCMHLESAKRPGTWS